MHIPFKRHHKKLLAAVGFFVIVVILIILSVSKASAPVDKTAGSTGTKKTASQTSKTPADSFNKSQYSLTDPTSLWVVVNKTRPLQPKTYAPNDLVVPQIPLRTSSSNGEMHLRQAATTALEKMTADAKTQGIYFMLSSGYRSYSLQVAVYNNEVSNFGKTKADTESARPGYSEHQTGLAMDLEDSNRLCEVTDCFANLPEGKWLAANAYKYGFLIRYPADKVAVTGYRYEPWHIRYVGTDLSQELHNQNIQTLEEFFSLPAAPDYL